ncbi:transglutaminase domain-containing protein [Pararhizobium sp. IMCC21322]|uniref:transglutaminase domain-containing protein n=1 Tax=Pararhizobium sp. IMCC21322 TaxID=3067903 RepID=UPI002741AFD6|nr:transglutaminase domain-containing protein [Pararhizobium sp. IMCC21322]
MINARFHLNKAMRLAFAAVVAAMFLAGDQTAAAADDWSVPPPGAANFSDLPERPVPSEEEALDYGKALETAVARNTYFEQAEQRTEDIALSLMLDPEAAFAYIRDEIRTEPYQGHLRQPDAVMAARGGNDHDKAQTLAELLRSMGYDTRLVEAPMTADMTEAIQAAACGQVGRGDDHVWRIAALQSETMARVKARAERSFSALHDALPDAVLPDPLPTASNQRHVWLQARIGRDWVDLDPTLASAKFGAKPPVAGEIVTDPVVPHRVSITLELESLINGKLRRKNILTQRLSVPEMTEQPVALFFGPAQDGIGGGLSDVLGGLAGKAPSMRAIMTVSGTMVKSTPFAAPGNVNQSTDLFQQEQSETVTAITLHVRSEVPGQTTSEEERVILDLLSAEQRRSVEDGGLPDPSAIAEPKMGQKYPAALESIRQIVLGNGGLSPRLAALRISGLLLELPETLKQLSVGKPDPEAVMWYSWVAASTVVLASEELIRARPASAGVCIMAARPRVLISGIQTLPEGGIVNWVDWTLDDIGIAGTVDRPDADATARLHRIWHGALQSALETEAILTQNGAPNGSIPPEKGSLIPLVGQQLAERGFEASKDLELGFSVFASEDMSADTWWRLDPKTGRADARVALAGNARPFFPKPGDGVARSGIADAANTAEGMAKDPKGFKERFQRDLKRQMRREAEAKRKADALRKKSKGGTEYTIILGNVSITISAHAGAGIGTAIMLAIGYALFG